MLNPDDLRIGKSIFCPREAWSGEIVSIVTDSYGDPGVLVVKNHYPEHGGEHLTVNMWEIDRNDLTLVAGLN